MKYRKSSLPALFKTSPLTAFAFLVFAIFYIIWFPMIWLIIWLIFLIFVLISILDDVLDYLDIKEDNLYIRDKKWVFWESWETIEYRKISKVQYEESFWKNLFGFWWVIITIESKEQKIDNIKNYKECVNKINNKLYETRN